MMRFKGSLLIAAMVTASLGLGGCVVEPVHQPYYGPVVRVAPPSPYYEYPGTPPVVGYVWISGYWNWGGVRYVWVPGRWEAPRSGYYWAPHRWEREGEHWRQHGGRWERGTAPQIVPVPAPAPRIERHEEHRPAPGTTYSPPRNEQQERQRFEYQERQRVEQQERQRFEQQERRHPESGPVYRPAPDRNGGSGEREIRRQPDDGGAVRFERRDGARTEREARPAPDRDGDRRQKRRDDDEKR